MATDISKDLLIIIKALVGSFEQVCAVCGIDPITRSDCLCNEVFPVVARTTATQFSKHLEI